MLNRVHLLAAAGAALTAGAALPTAAVAQQQAKALVYCPVVDITGCTRVADALSANSQFPGGVVKVDGAARDGVSAFGSVQLRDFAVFFVPSLSDINITTVTGEGRDKVTTTTPRRPYAALREAATASLTNFTGALTGRVVAFSGAVDQVTADGTKLIQNLAAWARKSHGALGAGAGAGTGVVVLLDGSDRQINAPYSWLPTITGGVSLAQNGGSQIYGGTVRNNPYGRKS
jgi:hypothetical protein